MSTAEAENVKKKYTGYRLRLDNAPVSFIEHKDGWRSLASVVLRVMSQLPVVSDGGVKEKVF